MSKHAKFSPSSAHRWVRCPYSVMGEQIKEDKKIFAEEGTRAHKVAESILKEEYFNVDNLCIDAYGEKDLSMLKYVNDYLDAIRSFAPYDNKFIETRIRLNSDCWGTADFIGVTESTIHIIDLKYGRGRVEAINNSQLEIYAVGAWLKLGKPSIQFKLHIVQPRIKHYASSKLTYDALHMLHIYYLDKIISAKENPTFKNTGPWCKWCKAKDCEYRGVWNR